MKKTKRFAASIVELFTRAINFVPSEHIYTNDSDNLYPNRVEITEKNSSTASSASGKLYSFIVGKGFTDKTLNELIVNKNTRLTGYGLLKKIAKSIKTHKIAYIHVNYDIEGEINYLDVLKTKNVRVSKKDLFGYDGVLYYKDWAESDGSFKGFFKDKANARWFYPFNPDKSVILDQRLRDGEGDLEKSILNYRGQVFSISLEEDEIYPHSFLHSAMLDADSEFRLSLYRNTNLREGFLDKTMLIPNGLTDPEYEIFKEKVKSWLGSENSGSVFVFAPSENIPDIEKFITTVTLKGSYDSDRFKNDEESFANNIRKSYLSIPTILIDPKEGIFGQSGDSLVEAIRYYNKETLFIRETISEALKPIFSDAYNTEITEL